MDKITNSIIAKQDVTSGKVQNVGRIMEQCTKKVKNIEQWLHGANEDIDEVNKFVNNLKRKYRHDVETKDTYHISVNLRKVKRA